MKQRKIIIAIDSFKGCLTSAEANEAAAAGIREVWPEAEVMQTAVSDGGEGWIEAFRTGAGLTLSRRPAASGERVALTVCDPLMRPVQASYLMLGRTAVIEIAQASGLTLLAPGERNPLRASTYGTGQLVADAIRRGCDKVIAGLGGSATSDCGMGMIQAIIDSLSENGTWAGVHQLKGVEFTIATDVANPLCGENGAACVFAPQKGATPEMVRLLDERARSFAGTSARHFGYDRRNQPGAGAAGGLGYAFMQYMNATCRPGIDLLLDTIGFDRLLSDAAMVITGEGSADRQTLMGKAAYGILRRAMCRDVPVCLIAGRTADTDVLSAAGFSHIACVNPPGLPARVAMNPEVAKQNIARTMRSVLTSAALGAGA